MKKTISAILFITLFHSGFSQSYKEQLKVVNDYLKTFDNGYYGYLEIKDGFLYDRFPSGKYSKSEIKYLGNAVALDNEYKISIECTDSKDCVFSTYTDSYHKNISFSQSEYFDKEVLVGLLNNLLTAYKKNTGNYKNDVALVENKTSTSSNNTYQSALKKLNDYLKTFDNGYYGYFEVINDELFIRLKTGFYCQAKIKDLDKAYVLETNKKIEIRCLGGKNCMNATYTTGKTTGLKMYQDQNFDSAEFIQLINDLISTLKKSNSNTDNSGNEAAILKTNTNNSNNSTSNYSTKSTTNNNSTANYQTALKKLNDYLKSFDNGYYGYFEVKDGYVYDRFKAGKYNKFKPEDIEGAVVQKEYKRVILKCKYDNKCIATDWKENEKEEYSQFLNGSEYNYQELADLFNNFIASITGKKINTSTNNSTITDNSSRNQKANERQQSTNKINNNDIEAYNLKSSNDEDFKKGDKIIIKEVYSLDNHYRLNGKSLCVGEKGTIISIGYDEINFSFFGKIKMNNGKTEEFDDFEPELISSTSIQNNKTKDNNLNEDRNALKKVETVSSANKNYQEQLKKLNDYLKTFNAETYRDVEVKDGKVFFGFFVYGAKYNSSIDISELKNNTIITIGKSVGSSVIDEVKISCKGESKCFYSLYSKETTNHFRFFSNTIKDFSKMEQLVKDFIKSL
jgi:hypothetical protein